MDYSNFIILLARQRSGTNVLRSALKSHRDIFCAPELFNNRLSTDLLMAEGNARFSYAELWYFHFVEKHLKGDMRKLLLMEDHEHVFLDLLEYLRCFTDRKYMVLDVKYMSSHHISKCWHYLTEEPFLFALIKKYNLRVLNVTRKHLLRYYLSELKAQSTQQWYEFDERVVGEQPWYLRQRKRPSDSCERQVRLDPVELVNTLALCRAENELVEESFCGYEHYLTFDYADMFSHIGARLSDSILRQIARWLQIDAAFEPEKVEYKKQSYLALDETIENYAAVAEALRGTELEYCLEDESIYRNSSEVARLHS